MSYSVRAEGLGKYEYIFKVVQNTKTIPGDLKRVAVTQTPAKDHWCKKKKLVTGNSS